jgi:ubiquinone biosynthesis protein
MTFPSFPRTRKPHVPLSASVKVSKRIRKATARCLARRQLAMPASGAVRIRVGANGASRHADVRLPPVPSAAWSETAPTDDVLGPMPRRTQVQAQPAETLGRLPAVATGTPKVGILQVLNRLRVWFSSIAAFSLWTLWDLVRRRDSQERRAVRLRRVIERAGGTFIKVGQQMSIRLDLLPVRYCQELALLLDSVPPFPLAEAIAVIERTTGKKLDEIFSAFDPEPIGSASIACVYQAVLKDTGGKVAVKVRRPGICEVFEADFQVLDALTKSAEWLTIVRPGFAENFRSEFRTVLSSELDFKREARLQELFARRARKAAQNFFTAPKVYAEWSNEEVLVMEFVSGMWLSEVLLGVEHADAAALARMRELNLDPKTIARRLLYTNSWGLFDNLAFHADPHPANIVVRANNELVFVDFGACGYLNRTRRIMYERIYDAYMREDIWTMAQLTLISVEPLPPMDVNAVIKDMEAAYQDHILMIKSKQTYWYERTSANMWLASLAVVNRYKIPAPIDILMYARATLLYDTLAARLWPQVDFYDEFQTFTRDVKDRVRKRSLNAMGARLRVGLTGADFEMLDRLASTGSGLLFRLQRLFAAPYDFTVVTFVVGKWIYLLSTVIRFVLRGLAVTAVAVLIAVALQALTGQLIALEYTLQQVVANRMYELVIGLLALVHLRMILFRLNDRTRSQ